MFLMHYFKWTIKLLNSINEDFLIHSESVFTVKNMLHIIYFPTILAKYSQH